MCLVKHVELRSTSLCSKRLESSDLQVIVIEKGTYTPAAELTTLEKDAYDNLYEKGGLMMTTEDGGESDNNNLLF
jgi:hypothetical protein